MSVGIIGEKVGMTQVFSEDGRVTPVTIIQAGSCRVSQVKKTDRDGYEAIQIAYKQMKRVNKPLAGHFGKAKISPARYLREIRTKTDGIEIGQEFKVDIFQKGEKVDVTGITKGKGFMGVMRRHHFSGGPATHGSMFHRAPGSIGSSSYPSRVWKNKGMPGHMGVRRRTVLGVEVVDVRAEEGLILVKGAVPGSPGGLLIIKKSKK